jgi:hypothetical protein
MWPAPHHLGSRFAAVARPIPGEAAAGDHLQAEYHLWLVGDQIERGGKPWLDPYTFQPESTPRINLGGWPFGLPYWPFVAIFGTVLAWNVFLLLTYLAAGGFACLWLRELGLDRGAALVGGLAFALAPYRVAQSAGHLRGPVSVLLPLALWAFERSRRGSRWWLVAAGAAIGSIPFSDAHLALGAVPFFLLYAVFRTRDPLLLAGALAGVLAGVGAGALVEHVAISGSISSGGRSLREVAYYSADGLDFVTRHRRHGLESFVFLGWLTPLLAIAGLALLLRARRIGLAVVLAIGAVVPILLALGTHFPLYSTLWHHFAPLRYPRVPERQMPIACLALAALAALAVARVARSFPRQVTVGYLIAVVAVAIDLRVEIYDAAAAGPGNRAYGALRTQPPGRLLELPVLHPGVDLGSAYLYYDQVARRERPGGYSTVAPKRAALLSLRLQPLNCGEWRPGSVALLRRLGVRYFALHSGLLGDRAWFAWRALGDHGYGRLARDGGVTVLAPGRRLGQAPMPEPTRDVVFCESLARGSPRFRHSAFWARGSAVRIELTTRAPDRTTFIVGDRVRGSVRVTGPTSVRFGLGGPGWHLVGVDVVRTDRGLRLHSVRSVSR